MKYNHIVFWFNLHSVSFRTSDNRSGSNPCFNSKERQIVINQIKKSLGIDNSWTIEIL